MPDNNLFVEYATEALELAKTHDQTLYGVNKTNGLVGEMKDVKKLLQSLQRLSWMILGGLVVLSAGVFWKVFFAVN
jgi:hypothetical protein